MNALKTNNPDALISVEPFTHAVEQSPVSSERLRQLCGAGDVFSPNELEAISLVGPGTPVELVTRLAAAGAAIVCLRRGEKGAVVHDARTGETWSVPAVLGDKAGSQSMGQSLTCSLTRHPRSHTILHTLYSTTFELN